MKIGDVIEAKMCAFLLKSGLFGKLKKEVKTSEAVSILEDKRNAEDVLLHTWSRRFCIMFACLIFVAVSFFYCQSNTLHYDYITDENHLDIKDADREVSFNYSINIDGENVKDHFSVYNNIENESGSAENTEASPEEMKSEIMYEVRDAIEESINKQRDTGLIKLPEKVGGLDVRYFNDNPTTDYSLFIIALCLLALIPVLIYKKQSEKIEARREQLVIDYPVFINKFSLLLGAGLTVRGVVEKLCNEYKVRLESGGEKRYLYDELLVTNVEMQNSISESKAVEDFGRRCKDISYMRFASIVSQNVRKGSDGLREVLDCEVQESFKKRKENAKSLGEKASTKLLIPCVLMLGVVMAIIMMPAFMTL